MNINLKSNEAEENIKEFNLLYVYLIIIQLLIETCGSHREKWGKKTILI